MQKQEMIRPTIVTKLYHFILHYYNTADTILQWHFYFQAIALKTSAFINHGSPFPKQNPILQDKQEVSHYIVCETSHYRIRKLSF